MEMGINFQELIRHLCDRIGKHHRKEEKHKAGFSINSSFTMLQNTIQLQSIPARLIAKTLILLMGFQFSTAFMNNSAVFAQESVQSFPEILKKNKLIVNCRLAKTNFNKVTWNENITAIVIPGGNTSQDFYPTNDAVPDIFKDGQIKSVEVLSDQMIQNYKNFITGKNVHTIWSLNINDTLQNQIACVQRLLDNGISISYLRLGCETYLAKYRYGLTDELGVAKVITMDDYIQILEEWAPALYQEFGIPLLWVGASYDDKTHENMLYRKNWAKVIPQFMKDHPQVREYFAGVILHHYEKSDADGSGEYTKDFNYISDYLDWSIFTTESGTENADWSTQGKEAFRSFHIRLKEVMEAHPKRSYPGLHVLYSPRAVINHMYDLNNPNGQTPLGEVLQDYPWGNITSRLDFKIYGKQEDSVFLMKNAVVTVNDKVKLSDSIGEAKFSILNGTVNYKIQQSGFITMSGIINLQEDRVVIDTLEMGFFNVSLLVKEKESDQGIVEIPVSFGGIPGITTSAGLASFERTPAGINAIHVENEEFFHSGEVEVLSDTTFVIYPNKKEYRLDIYVKDIFSQLPIIGAHITTGDITKETDIEGKLFMELSYGDYELIVSAPGYPNENALVMIKSDTTITIRLSPGSVELRFRVYHGLTPMNNVAVTLAGNTRTTNSLGLCTFSDLNVATPYDVSFRRTAYKDIDTTITIFTNNTLDIQMELATGDSKTSYEKVDIYPNPFSNSLNINTPSPIHSLIISDVLGEVVFRSQWNAPGSISLDLSNLINGMYFISLEFENNNTKRQMIIKR